MHKYNLIHKNNVMMSFDAVKTAGACAVLCTHWKPA